ncbi:hypothetical protein BpHYR1_020553 [Brachionus plicatilis]|uniref:Uncharacterized protein n=1 Tax=Brachionus plicatilis TaxID=10195 RepID=A0A3M7S8H2_BRAPC|nr:hypothetical protein BpHYR1_020553 [Brachionus plicatilis]
MNSSLCIYGTFCLRKTSSAEIMKIGKIESIQFIDFSFAKCLTLNPLLLLTFYLTKDFDSFFEKKRVALNLFK